MSLTREQLKAKLTPIVCDLTKTKEERSALLGPIFIEMIPESIRKETKGVALVEAFGDIWNNVMVEIVQENNLGADGRGIAK